jgi:ribonuclease-3 family protein
MEESVKQEIGLTDAILAGLSLSESNPRQLSPLVLAYIGDCVYDLVIKTYLLDKKGNMPVNKLNRMASNLVKAQTQSELIGIIEDKLTEDELAVYKRGRNAKSYTSAKNASIGDYRRATGFEALVGYLYLDRQYARMVELVREALVGFGEIKVDEQD